MKGLFILDRSTAKHRRSGSPCPPWSRTWIMPDGRTYDTVLGNDHAAVVMGYNSDCVLIRDVLGPTSTNWQRKYQYEVPWPKFLAAWASQQYDGLAVAPPGE